MGALKKAATPQPEAEFALAISYNAKTARYESAELHLSEGMVVDRKPLRAVAGAKEMFGHAIGDLEALVPEWRRKGLLK